MNPFSSICIEKCFKYNRLLKPAVVLCIKREKRTLMCCFQYLTAFCVMVGTILVLFEAESRLITRKISITRVRHIFQLTYLLILVELDMRSNDS